MSRVLVPVLKAAPVAPAGRLIELSGPTMGTTWSVKLVLPPGLAADEARAGVIRRLDQVVAQMSPWEPGSDLSRFNRATAGQRIALPAPMAEVLDCALEVAAASDGAFDPTIGAAVDLWGFGPAPVPAEPPTAARVAQAQNTVGWRRLEPQADGMIQPGGVTLDLCGVAKGFAVDHVADYLRSVGVTAYLVEIGGELRGEGVKPDGSPWWVALEQPPGATGDPYRLALHGLSVAASGDYRRSFAHEGVRHCHALDPATGRPIRNGVAAVAVLHESCMKADAEATAIMVLGLEAGLAYAEQRGLAALIQHEAGGGLDEHMTRAFAALLDD